MSTTPSFNIVSSLVPAPSDTHLVKILALCQAL